jgi:flavorubredoxin
MKPEDKIINTNPNSSLNIIRNKLTISDKHTLFTNYWYTPNGNRYNSYLIKVMNE